MGDPHLRGRAIRCERGDKAQQRTKHQVSKARRGSHVSTHSVTVWEGKKGYTLSLFLQWLYKLPELCSAPVFKKIELLAMVVVPEYQVHKIRVQVEVLYFH